MGVPITGAHGVNPSLWYRDLACKSTELKKAEDIPDEGKFKLKWPIARNPQLYKVNLSISMKCVVAHRL